MMKRLFALLFILLTLTMAVSAASGNQLVYDDANLLSSAEESRLEEKLQSVSSQCGAQILVVTIPSYQGNLDSYAGTLYDAYSTERDGVLLLVCMDPREYRILSNGYAADEIGPHEFDMIGNAIVSDLSDGYYSNAFHEYARQCDHYLNDDSSDASFDLVKNLLIALAVGLVAGLIVALVLKSQLKSVHRQNQANVYVKHGSMHLTTHHDIFLYRNVTRRRRESSSSGSRSSGGSRRVGGGKF